MEFVGCFLVKEVNSGGIMQLKEADIKTRKPLTDIQHEKIKYPELQLPNLPDASYISFENLTDTLIL